MALKDTLTQLKQRQEHETEWESSKPKLIEEWKEAVSNLFAQMRSYLAEYETEGSMSFAESEMQLSEERLGKYSIRKMDIGVPPFKIIVAPVGRIIIGASGRVDMYRQGRVGEADRIRFLRVPKSASDLTLQWAINPPPEIGTPKTRTPHRGPRQLLPLTKNVLEQAVEALLKRQ